jgi:predicted transcriptional regulator
MKSEIVKNISYVKLSKHRTKVLLTLGDNLMFPSNIAKKANMALSDVSRALKGLKDAKLVICLNEEDSQGRLYQITEKGRILLEYL